MFSGGASGDTDWLNVHVMKSMEPLESKDRVPFSTGDGFPRDPRPLWGEAILFFPSSEWRIRRWPIDPANSCGRQQKKEKSLLLLLARLWAV